jgi:hypothetical protein
LPGGLASGGNDVFAGGTPNEHQQITITIAAAPTPEAVPGEIWLDSGLLGPAVAADCYKSPFQAMFHFGLCRGRR